ncbi:unannotated protein [freshwater metagenome]|uniref:Unannotated protein n=1 Tax=freshwater metagenome TaxID=449393 RepID=A0A6J7CZP4_9ZZZZ
MKYIPALDGLRALAVAAVLCFHAQASFASGGFLGVSVFFTLSGYLITSLLLREHSATGTISLQAFYGRRLRRLLPAAYACIVLVLALGYFWTAYQREHLPGDVVAALTNMSNWRFAFTSSSYSDLFRAAPSPFAHFWSLAIEEQCYVMVPIIVLLALRRGRRTLLVTTIVLLTASLTATLLTTDFDLAYNGTHTRAAELLMGVLLAQLTLGRQRSRHSANLAGLMALVALGALAATTTVTDRWLYRGGLVGVAVLSATVIAALVGGGPLARILAWRPLVAVGRTSYGLYLVHWPIFMVLSPARTHLDGAALAVVRIGVSLAVTAVSYYQLEQPIRRRDVLRSPRSALVAMGVILPLLAVASGVAVPSAHYTPTQQLLAKGASGLVEFTPAAAPAAAPTPAAAPAPGPAQPQHPTASTRDRRVTSTAPRRVLVVGSDNAPVTLLSMLGYQVTDGVETGCPVAASVEVLLADATIMPTSTCEKTIDRWPRLISQMHPDLVIVSIGHLDRGIIRRASDPGFPTAGEISVMAGRKEAAYADLEYGVALIEAAGVPVVVVDHRPAPNGTADLEPAYLNRLRLSHPKIGGVVTTDQDLLTTTQQLLEAPRSVDPRVHVLVIGDSTSLDLAQALSDAAPDRLVVTWAGENGCPFVRLSATLLSSAQGWQSNQCIPFDAKVPGLIDSFQPQVVLMVASLFELAEQRYPGDPTGYIAGDPAFTAFHDSEMAAFEAILRARGVPLLIADSPTIRAIMATPEQADPSRTTAWNAQIRRWDDSSPYIGIFDYAGPLVAAEAALGSIRPDGVHPEIGPLTTLARAVYVDELIARTEAIRASLGLLAAGAQQVAAAGPCADATGKGCRLSR